MGHSSGYREITTSFDSTSNLRYFDSRNITKAAEKQIRRISKVLGQHQLDIDLERDTEIDKETYLRLVVRLIKNSEFWLKLNF